MKPKPKIALPAKIGKNRYDWDNGRTAFGHDEEPRIKNKLRRSVQTME